MSLLLLFASGESAAQAAILGYIEAMLHARLVETGGGRVEHFSTTTEPTRDQVLVLIDMFSSIMYSRTGPLDTLTCERASALVTAAQVLIAQRVALEIELSFRPEEVGESAAQAAELRRVQLEADLTALVANVDLCRSDDETPGGESDSPHDAAWSFPAPEYLDWVG